MRDIGRRTFIEGLGAVVSAARPIGLRTLLLTATCLVTTVLADQQDETARPDGPKTVPVPMRDGVKLSTIIYLPQGKGPWPTILHRTPYGKSRSGGRYVTDGYAYVSQDQRGRGGSEGDYRPHEAEMKDGYDTVEWVASQAWCNGKVGMTGTSAPGIAANLAAASSPPHLSAAFVRVAPHSLFYEGRFIGGVFKEADTGNWMRRQGVSEEEINAYKKRVVLDDRWQRTDLIFHRHNIRIPMYHLPVQPQKPRPDQGRIEPDPLAGTHGSTGDWPAIRLSAVSDRTAPSRSRRGGKNRSGIMGSDRRSRHRFHG